MLFRPGLKTTNSENCAIFILGYLLPNPILSLIAADKEIHHYICPKGLAAHSSKDTGIIVIDVGIVLTRLIMDDRKQLDILSLDPSKIAGMLLLVLLLIFDIHCPTIEYKSESPLCTITDPSQFPWKYHQSGDFIIGAIVSQFTCIFDVISFSEHPKTRLIM